MNKKFGNLCVIFMAIVISNLLSSCAESGRSEGNHLYEIQVVSKSSDITLEPKDLIAEIKIKSNGTSIFINDDNVVCTLKVTGTNQCSIKVIQLRYLSNHHVSYENDGRLMGYDAENGGNPRDYVFTLHINNNDPKVIYEKSDKKH